MHFRILFFLILSMPVVLMANAEPPSYSDAGTDGPYVLYQSKKIVVKSLEIQDSTVEVRSRTYDDAGSVILTCNIPESDDHFYFSLQDSLTIPASEYSLPDQMLVLSDIEGNFQALKTMLQGAHVMDESFEWVYGKGHLVLIGDFFDRGLNVTESLWLIYKLEKEAQKAGGMVHFILGNHEVLNLAGNNQYVRKKYLANARLLGEDYSSDLYGINSELGRWLRTKNAVEKIGDYVFCHGGYSPNLAATGMSIFDINDVARLHYGVPKRFISTPEAKAVFDVNTGIFWFRQASKNQLSVEDMDQVLAHLDAKHIVVGHTLVPDVTALYGGRLICVDLYHDENYRLGRMKTLYIEKGLAYSLDSSGIKSSVFSIVFPKGK